MEGCCAHQCGGRIRVAEPSVTAPAEVWVTVGEPQRGLWCDACALPSVITVHIQALSKRGVGRTMAARCTNCENCEPDRA